MEQTVPSTFNTLLKGICLRCPQCGIGKLFKSYLKQNDACPYCGEPLKQYRADDGPAWLTILLTGHLTVPLLVHFVRNDTLPYWAEITVMFALTTALVFALLPPCKGAFISVLWMLAQKKK